jgi:flagellar hook-associated protein 2
MSRITSSIGLITGIPIEETVKKLMEVAARPRDTLKTRNEGLKQQQAALGTLSSRLLAFQFEVNKLKAPTVYQAREAASSNDDVLTAALPVGGTATVGSYLVRPVRAAAAHQVLSQHFERPDAELGGGALTLQFGGFVDTGISLDQLNGGAGVPRGRIRITDRGGATTTIDLSLARTVDDVVDAINANLDVAVTASTNGDSLTLTDHSGGTGNLRVQEVGTGTTAAGLGLAGVNVAASQATGSDVLRLHAGSKLTSLNDGNGVALSGEGVVDLEVTLSDGSELSIDLFDAATLGDVIEQINAADPAKLSAAISADGRRLALADLTSGAGDFAVANGAASTAAEDLGVAGTTDGATLTGGRLVAGLRDTLLASLHGGRGLGPLGVIGIANRAGGADSVDLSSAETLGDVVELINASTAQVTAAFNDARNGIVVVDASGGSGALSISSGDATDSAEALGIVVDDEVASVNSGTLRRQTLSEASLLSSLNGGKGIVVGDIRVTDSHGVAKSADLNTPGSEARTVGDVINAINALGNGVQARINDTGDGILVIDTAGGDGVLGVADINGDTAKALNLTRASATVEIDGDDKQVIDGTRSYAIDLDHLESSKSAIPLASLNGGAGVPRGTFIITDSNGGNSIAIDLEGADAGITTVGQLIDAINARAEEFDVGVTARINDSASGILLEDTAGGAGKLAVRDVKSTAAASLKIAGQAVVSGDSQVIDGIGTFPPASTATGLEALAARINELDAGVTATVVFDGVGHRLSLASDDPGAVNQLLVDGGESGITFEEVSKAQDALLLYGSSSSSGGVLLASPDGTFRGAVGGVDLAVHAASETPVTVTVNKTDATLVAAFEELVESYNALRDDLGKMTAFDPDAQTTGLLFATSEALQVDSRLSRALTNRYFGLGGFDSLVDIGLAVSASGKLELDTAKLQEAFDADPEGLQRFLTDGKSGVAVKLGDIIDQLAGANGSVLDARTDALQETIESNDGRLAKFDEQLGRQEERLLLQFFQLESIIAKMQTSLSAVQGLQALPPLGRTRR